MNWTMVEIGRVAEVRGGATPRRDEPAFWGGEFPWVTPTDLPGLGSSIVEVERTADTITEDGLASCSASLLPRGTVLFSSRATIGKVGIAAVPLATNQGFANLIPCPGVDSRYLAWCLHFYADRIAALAGSTTFKEVSKSAIKGFRVPLPLLSEQRRIVEILDQADRLRRLRAAANAKADRILPALFIKMFGDPARNPKGWPVTTLGELEPDLLYGTSQRCDVDQAGIPVLRIPNVIRGEVDRSDLKYGKFSTRDRKRLKLEAGDLLFVRTNGNPDYVGRCAVVEEEETRTETLFASYLIRARLDRSRIDPHYLSAFLCTPAGRRAMAPYIRTTAGQSNISTAGLRQVRVLVPPYRVQVSFEERWHILRSMARYRLSSRASLERLFVSLLDRAFSGSLTTAWREAHMKELLQEMEHQARALGTPSSSEART